MFSPMDRFVRLRVGMARPLQFVASPLPSWARRIKSLRKSLGLNQLDFGKGLNCSSMVISRWERGLQKPPADAQPGHPGANDDDVHGAPSPAGTSTVQTMR